MFSAIFLFELKYRIARPATWIYFGVFFLLGFVIMLLLGGNVEGISAQLSGGAHINANSPYTISSIISSLSLFGTIIVSAIVGNPVYRDFEHNTHALFFTKPITKAQYLGGRFLGSAFIALLAMTGIGFGIFAATQTPWVEAQRMGPFSLMAYIQPYVQIVIPNLLFAGAVFFTTASLTRSMVPNYVGCIILYVLLRTATTLVANIDNQVLAGLLDPLGRSAMSSTVRYWTAYEKNHLLIPFSGLLLANRLVWMGVAALIWAFCYWRFRFGHFVSDKKRKQAAVPQSATANIPQPAEIRETARLSIPRASLDFSFRQLLRQFAMLTKLEFSSIVRNIYFLVIVLVGILFLLLTSTQLGKLFDTPTLPVTYQVTDLFSATFGLFMLIIIIFYSGELVWRERSAKIEQLMDALPLPNGLLYGSKLAALMLVQVLLLAVVMVFGIVLQAMRGYFHFDFPVYFKALFGVNLISWWLMCVLAMLVQVLVNNKYLGHFVMVIYYIIMLFLPALGVEHKMLEFGSDPGIIYSDMNGYGHFVWPFIVFKVYWAGFALLLAIVSNLYFVRGTETRFRTRRKMARARFTGKVKLATLTGLLVFMGTGGYIFYNTNILNTYTTSKESEKEAARYEKTFGKFRNSPQPKIVAVNVNVNIFPKERSVTITGSYTLKNKTNVPIDSVHVLFAGQAKVNKLGFDKPAKQVLYDKDLSYYIFRLDHPLLPGDSTVLNMDLAYESKGFTNSGFGGAPVVYNGTFFNNKSVMPTIGYSEEGELSGSEERKKYGLARKERMPAQSDTMYYRRNVLSADADWIRFETVVSTTDDQVALAPGYLLKDWKENGRHYFHYKMDVPILNFYAFQSARYEVKRDKWNDVNIEIYYDQQHPYNIDRMIKGIKKALDYYTKNFSPYQHHQVRIVEFPRYAAFAQSFPNTIPYSEGIGFIADVDDSDPEAIDYPFYVTAHEVAHQWWGHQVIGANVQGATLMMETMAQYSALMVMEKEYGPEKMRKFLRYEMDSYLRGRSAERVKELPMVTMEGQQYIHYNKGSVVMYALKDYIGEDSLNAALRRYIKKTAYQEAPFTTSTEFVDSLRAATPDSLKSVIHDLFETITLFDNKITGFESQKQPDGKYKVTLTVESKKFRADSVGNETAIAVNDWIDIAVFGRVKENGHYTTKPLYFKKHHITKATTKIEVIVDSQPSEGGIDPYNKLIDRVPSDNTGNGSARLTLGGR